MITLLLIIPIIGALLIAPIQENSLTNQSRMKIIAISTSLLNLFLSILLWLEFDANTTQYQFVYEFDYLTFCQFNFGVDGLVRYLVCRE